MYFLELRQSVGIRTKPYLDLPCTKHPEPHGDVGISGTDVARNGFLFDFVNAL